MDFSLSDEHQALQGAVREFVDHELMPLESSARQRGGLSRSTMERLRRRARRLGLWHLDVPAEYGGRGVDFLGQCLVTEQLARTAALPFRYAGIFGPDVRPILFHCTDEQKERFLLPLLRGEVSIAFAQTEPDAGSDPAAMTTTAVADGDEYVLNGLKHYIGGARDARYAQVMAVVPADASGRGGISCFVVDLTTKGVSVRDHEPLLVDDQLSRIEFKGARVPAANLVGEPGDGFALGQEWITQGRVRGHGARCVGIAARALELMISYSRSRVTFGEPLSNRQAVQFMVADSTIELQGVRLMVYETAWRYDRGEDVRDLSYMVKIAATEMATRVVDRAIQIHGARGLSSELPLEWWYRQVRSIRITEGATEVLRWRLARNLMRERR